MDPITSAERHLDLIDCGLRFQSYSLIRTLGINKIFKQHDCFLSAQEICERIEGRKINAQYLQRILRYLSCFQVFTERMDEGVVMFKGTEVLQLPYSVVEQTHSKVAPHLIDLLEGKLTAPTLYEHIFGHRVEVNYKSSMFKNQMAARTRDIAPGVPQIAEEIILEGKQNSVIIDIGGCSGEMMRLLYEALPTLSCINFDLLEVIQTNEAVPNIQMVAGDMFNADTIPQCEIIFTKNILHDFSDDDCVKMLCSFHQALPEDGLLLSANSHLGEPNEEEQGYHVFGLDLMMMMVFGDAKQRTLSEYKELHRRAGFEIRKCVRLKTGIHPTDLLTAKKLIK